MDIWQDPIGTYRMKGDIRQSPMGFESWAAEGLKKRSYTDIIRYIYDGLQ
jgi:hypothetical protein